MANGVNAINPESLLIHADFVRAVARRLIRDEHSAEDVAQKTWMVALDKQPDADRSVRAWLAGIARNISLRTLRADGRRKNREQAAAVSEEVRSTAEIVEKEALRKQVVETVLLLREPYRTVILFRYYDNLTPRSIAKRLDIPVETVKTRIQRGLDQLRSSFDKNFDGDRKAWCLALAPLAGFSVTASSTGGAVIAIPVLTGALLMSAKVKFFIGVALLLSACLFSIYTIMQDNNVEQTDFSIPLVDINDSTKDGKTTGIVDGKAGEEKKADDSKGLIDSIGDNCFCINGKVVMKDGGFVPAGLKISSSIKAPPFSRFDLFNSNESICIITQEELLEQQDGALLDGEGRFLLKGVSDREQYILPLHPFVRMEENQNVKPFLLKDIESAKQNLIVLEPAGVVEGVVLKPDGSPVPMTEVTYHDEDLPITLISGGGAEKFSSLKQVTSKDGTFRFEQTPVNRRMVLSLKVDGYAPMNIKPVVAIPGRKVHVPIMLKPPSLTFPVMHSPLLSIILTSCRTSPIPRFSSIKAH